MNVSFDQVEIERIADAVIGRLGDGAKRTQWLTTTEAAEHLRCSVRHVQKLARLGELKSYKPAGSLLFKAEELDQYVSQTEGD